MDQEEGGSKMMEDTYTSPLPIKAEPTVHWAKEALEPQPDIPWVIEGIISIPTINVVFGEGGTLKTYSLMDAGVCVAMGEPWLGFKTTRYPVLFIDEESGNRRFARRLGDVMRGHNAPKDLQLAYTCLEGFNLAEGCDVRRLKEIIKKTGAKLVIIDALVDVMLGRDENLVKDIQPVFHNLRNVANDLQCTIIIIHHGNRQGDYRGSSVIKGAVDLMLQAKKPKDSNIVGFECAKTRDVTVDPFSAAANFEDGKFYLIPSNVSYSSEKKEKGFSDSQAYVMSYLAKHKEASVKEIMDHADSCSPNAARQAIYKLAKKECVERANEGGSGTEAIYRTKAAKLLP
jgi:hypothetical protein